MHTLNISCKRTAASAQNVRLVVALAKAGGTLRCMTVSLPRSFLLQIHLEVHSYSFWRFSAKVLGVVVVVSLVSRVAVRQTRIRDVVVGACEKFGPTWAVPRR